MRRRSCRPKKLFGTFQSTHPHGVRLTISLFDRLFTGQFQSTHPHGVRRQYYGIHNRPRQISIHAPTRGATTSVLLILAYSLNFNPRTHTGCDARKCFAEKRGLNFNPRTHTGCDDIHIYHLTRLCPFQSTHPHGVRQRATGRDSQASAFQSTHPHGVRQQKHVN